MLGWFAILAHDFIHVLSPGSVIRHLLTLLLLPHFISQVEGVVSRLVVLVEYIAG